MEKLTITGEAARHVDAYANYYNIVGNADGGKMFTEKQFEEYKEHLKKNAKNRVYSSWRNANGLDCKVMGPATKCQCDHRYRDHNYINPINKKTKCTMSGCACACFYYIPVHGSQDFKCLCKHSYREHDVKSHKCTKPGCKCTGLTSSFSCTCGMQFPAHKTVAETREERIRAGKSVDDVTGMLGDAGGLTSFTALVDGAERFENQDWGPVRDHYQQKALQADMSRMAITNQSESMGAVGKSLPGKGQMSVIPGRGDGPSTALELYNTPHSFARKVSTTKKFLTRKPLNY